MYPQRSVRAHQGQELARGVFQVFDVWQLTEEPGLLQLERQAVLRHPRQADRAPEPAGASFGTSNCATVSIPILSLPILTTIIVTLLRI